MYSQYGEDEKIAAIFDKHDWIDKGNLLDIGAYSAEHLSNSRMFIDMGWSAVLVEFSPGPLRSLVQHYADNPRVQVVSAAVTPEPNHVLKFDVTDDALSTEPGSETRRIWSEAGGYYGSLWVQTLPLEALLTQFFGDRTLHYATIDTEGTSVDLAIALLRMRQPDVLCVEHDSALIRFAEVYEPLGYRQVHVNQTNVIIAK